MSTTVSVNKKCPLMHLMEKKCSRPDAAAATKKLVKEVVMLKARQPWTTHSTASLLAQYI